MPFIRGLDGTLVFMEPDPSIFCDSLHYFERKHPPGRSPLSTSLFGTPVIWLRRQSEVTLVCGEARFPCTARHSHRGQPGPRPLASRVFPETLSVLLMIALSHVRPAPGQGPPSARFGFLLGSQDRCFKRGRGRAGPRHVTALPGHHSPDGRHRSYFPFMGSPARHLVLF